MFNSTNENKKNTEAKLQEVQKQVLDYKTNNVTKQALINNFLCLMKYLSFKGKYQVK